MNHTADKVFDYCDVLGFQISGGKKPYDVSVHSYGVPLYNATLGGDDDVFEGCGWVKTKVEIDVSVESEGARGAEVERY